MISSSKIYVAGHRGLVGSAIWGNLKKKGYTNLIGRTIDELDLMDQEATARFFAKEKPEYVFLAAAKVGGIIANNTFRAEFIHDNLVIQNNVIHQSWKHGVKKLLFLGSTCIYPRDCPQPMKEEYLLTGPLEYTNEPYAIAKIAGIRLCESYNLQYGTDFLSVMPTNLYGPNDNFDLDTSHVLPALLRKIHLGMCLENNDWNGIMADMARGGWRGGEGAKGREGEEITMMREVLESYGIRVEASTSESINASHAETSGHSGTQKALLPVSVTLWGSGSPLREFLWSEDMADACVFVMEHISFRDLAGSEALPSPQRNKENTQMQSGPLHADKAQIRNTHINIGTGMEISISDLAALIKDTIGFRGELRFDATRPDGTQRKLTDPSKLHKLGWRHTVELEEGVKRLYKWYLERKAK